MSADAQPDLAGLAALDRVVHEPARLLLLAHLYVLESADFLFLLRQTGLTRGNLSAHVRKLEEAGYVRVEKTFVDRLPMTIYNLTDAGRAALEQYRTQMIGALNALG
jgi:DNA-binding MarR family transcriptional regulator